MVFGYSYTFKIGGMIHYIEPHQKLLFKKQRIQLKNRGYKVAKGIYVKITLAGRRSQAAITTGSAAAVVTDILTL